MNFYNPYFGVTPYSYAPTLSSSALSSNASSRGLLGGLFSGGKLSNFINGTQKTLGIINQAIPIVKQMSPVIKNAKTMFKVMNEFKRVDGPSSVKKDSQTTIINTKTNGDTKVEENVKSINTSNNNGPTFFL